MSSAVWMERRSPSGRAATANTIGKMALGIDDTPVTAATTPGQQKSVAVVRQCTKLCTAILLAQNLETLRAMGVNLIDPRTIGSQDRRQPAGRRLRGFWGRRPFGKRILIAVARTSVSPWNPHQPRLRKGGIALGLEAYRRGRQLWHRCPGSSSCAPDLCRA